MDRRAHANPPRPNHPAFLTLYDARARTRGVLPLLKATWRKLMRGQTETPPSLRAVEAAENAFQGLENKLFAQFDGDVDEDLTHAEEDAIFWQRCEEIGDHALHESCSEIVSGIEAWHDLAAKLVRETLTEQEKEHAIAFDSNKKYRHSGDSLMAKAHRHKDEVMRDLTSNVVMKNGLTKDVDLMKLYLQLRKGFSMFCLSADDQEAYDLVMASLDRMPGEFQRALAARTQSP